MSARRLVAAFVLSAVSSACAVVLLVVAPSSARAQIECPNTACGGPGGGQPHACDYALNSTCLAGGTQCVSSPCAGN